MEHYVRMLDILGDGDGKSIPVQVWVLIPNKAFDISPKLKGASKRRKQKKTKNIKK